MEDAGDVQDAGARGTRVSPARRGNPDATGPAILAIADAEEPPLRVFLGDQPLPLMRTEYAQRIAEWEAWDDLSRAAFG